MTGTSEPGTNLADDAGVQPGDAPGVAVADEVDDALPGQSDGTQVDGDAEDGEAPEVELIEVERGGKKYSIPKALESELLMQADYTRKTQEHAANVRAAQAELQQQQQAIAAQAEVQRQHVSQYARIAAMDQQITQYQSVDWAAAMRNDPAAAQAAWMEFQQLKERRSGAVEEVAASERQMQSRIAQQSQESLARGAEVMAQAMSGWAPDTVRAVNDIGQRAYGVRAEHLQFFAANPGLIPILHDAVQYQLIQQRAKQAAKGNKQQVQAAVVPTLQASAPAAAKRLDDRSSTDAWMAQRNAQLSKRKR